MDTRFLEKGVVVSCDIRHLIHPVLEHPTRLANIFKQDNKHQPNQQSTAYHTGRELFALSLPETISVSRRHAAMMATLFGLYHIAHNEEIQDTSGGVSYGPSFV